MGAPERIWAWWNNQPQTKYHRIRLWADFYPHFKKPTRVWVGTSWWNPLAGYFREEPVAGGLTEYRRADLPPTLADALALPEIAALVEAAIVYKDERMKLDDTPAFCDLITALSAIKKEPS